MARSQDTDFHYECIVTLTLKTWHWVKVITHPLVMDNNCATYSNMKVANYGQQVLLLCVQCDFDLGDTLV